MSIRRPHQGSASFRSVATLRGDFVGFFGAGGILSVMGAVRNDARYLAAPLLMIGRRKSRANLRGPVRRG